MNVIEFVWLGAAVLVAVLAGRQLGLVARP